MVKEYPARGVLGLSLMTGQAFLYNAIFFTYTLVLTSFFGVSAKSAGLFLVPFAVGNFFGPRSDRCSIAWGRKTMISTTYITSGVLLVIHGAAVRPRLPERDDDDDLLVDHLLLRLGRGERGVPDRVGVFPMEVRAMAIALFYSVGTGFAILSPTLFGALIATKSRVNVSYGYLLGAALMIGAGLVAVFLAVAAERRSLEDVARPLTAVRSRLGGGAAAPARAK